MVLGRNPALWAALVAAALNVVVLLNLVVLDGNQVAALNVFAVAVIGIIANESDPTTLPTLAAALHDRRSPAAGGSSSGMASSSGAAGGPTSAARRAGDGPGGRPGGTT